MLQPKTFRECTERHSPRLAPPMAFAAGLSRHLLPYQHLLSIVHGNAFRAQNGLQLFGIDVPGASVEKARRRCQPVRL